MIFREFFIELLVRNSVYEVFGIPGGVVLDFLEALNSDPRINSRLSFHEQSAVFSAMGYARSRNCLGAAYATRGPGITNTLSAVADAFFDSVPLVVVTGHSGDLPPSKMRTMADQEIDIVNIFKPVTKMAVRIDSVEDIKNLLIPCFEASLLDRPGPVLLDIKSDLWGKEVFGALELLCQIHPDKKVDKGLNLIEGLKSVADELAKSVNPILLLGDGFRGHNRAILQIVDFSTKNKIPILSGRFSQDLFKNAPFYFGYIGSHGLRSGNQILCQADLLICVGNRMHYPVDSTSWKPLMERLKVLRFDIDDSEFLRRVPNQKNFKVHLTDLCNNILGCNADRTSSESWTAKCHQITDILRSQDYELPIPLISDILDTLEPSVGITCDVGNNEFWVSKGYFNSRCTSPLIFSKSFGAMGSALGKAIGYSHGTGSRTLCFVGDQAFLMNVQDLHYIAEHSLPIKILLMNNLSSGMIRSRQKNSGRELIQTTFESGYSLPNFRVISESFGIQAFTFDQEVASDVIIDIIHKDEKPALIEIITPAENEGIPHMPKGSPPQSLSPRLPNTIQSLLNKIQVGN